MPDAPDLYPGLLLDAAEVGALRWRERVLPPLWVPLGTIGLAVALGAVLVPLQGPAALATPLALVLLVAVFVAVQALDVQRVHERALVTGVWRKPPYVVPWATVDPELVRLHTRANFINRRIGPDVRRSARQAVWSRNVISLIGLDPDYAHPGRRAGRLQDVRAMLYRGQPLMPLRLTTWYFGTRHPEQMLRALEQALVDAGRPGAAGLAERCLAAPVRESFRQPPTDEQIYGGAPPRQLQQVREDG